MSIVKIIKGEDSLELKSEDEGLESILKMIYMT